MLPMIVSCKHRNMQWIIPLAGKYTIIRGKSGTGKTTFSQVVIDFKVTAGGLRLIPLPYAISYKVPEAIAYLNSVAPEGRAIFVGDEDLSYLHSEEFQKTMKASAHLFILITRRNFYALPHSTQSILEFIRNENTITAQTKYPLTQLQLDIAQAKKCNLILVEDSSGGKKLIKNVYSQADTYSGNGNAVHKCYNCKDTVVVVDELGFGAHITSCMDALLNYPEKNNRLLAWESFEYQIYKNLLDEQEEAPWDCSNKEQFYTDQVAAILKELTGVNYNKGLSIKCLGQSCCPDYKQCKYFKPGNKARIILGKYAELFEAIGSGDIPKTTHEFDE